MNAFLAACWLAGRATVGAMRDALDDSKLWREGGGAQRTVFSFLAPMLERDRLEALWIYAGDDDRRAVLGRTLAERAEREGWTLTRPAAVAVAAD